MDEKDFDLNAVVVSGTQDNLGAEPRSTSWWVAVSAAATCWTTIATGAGVSEVNNCSMSSCVPCPGR